MNKTVSLLFGIDNGILLHASDESSGVSINSTYQFKPLDIGVTGGIRWLLVKNTGLYFTYVLGLGLIEKPSVTMPLYNPATNRVAGSYTVTTDNADNLRNQAFQLGIFYNFQ